MHPSGFIRSVLFFFFFSISNPSQWPTALNCNTTNKAHKHNRLDILAVVGVSGRGEVGKGGHQSVDFDIIMQTAALHYITLQQQEQNITWSDACMRRGA